MSELLNADIKESTDSNKPNQNIFKLLARSFSLALALFPHLIRLRRLS